MLAAPAKKPVPDFESALGNDRVNVAIVACGFREAIDARRLANVGVIAEEQQTTAIGFLSGAVAWFNGRAWCRQVMSDNGPSCLSSSFAKTCGAVGLRHNLTRPYTPRTNVKAERLIQSLCREWAYSMPYQHYEERNRWLPGYLSIYNRIRSHSARGGRSPQQRLNELFC
jgi:hypothetical protein